MSTQALIPAHAQSTPIQGFLHTEGRWIVDDHGLIFLRGANFFGYEYGLWGIHTEEDYHKMASWGFNVVRLPIAWNFIEPSPGHYDESYFSNYVDRDIAWAKENGLYVILDMHQYFWSSYFTYYDSWRTAGLPSWEVSSYPNTADGDALAKANFWNGLGPNGTISSSENPSMRERFVEVWKYVAARYSQENAVAGYDLLNEPMIYDSAGKGITHYDPSKFVSQTLPAFYETLIDAVRSVDAAHMIFWEPASIWNMNTSPVNRPNVVYSPHYPGFLKGMTQYGYDGDNSRLTASFEELVVTPSETWNQPAFVGEWGICAEATNATQYIHDMADLLDGSVIGAAWWTYGKGTFGMNLLDISGNERLSLVENIVHPFLRESSVPISLTRFDPDMKAFRVGLTGVAVLNIYLPSWYLSSFVVKVDKGSKAFEFSSGILTVSVSAEATELVVQSGSLVPQIRG